MRPLGVTTAGETRHVPGVKSFAQQGFPEFEAPTWWAFVGCAGTPPAILKRMEEALHGVIGDVEARAKIEDQGADVVAAGPEQCRAFLTDEVEKWGKVIRENNISLDS